MTNAVQKPVFRVLAWDPMTMMWTVRSEHDDLPEARESAEALQHKGLRTRVISATARVLITKQPITNQSRAFRLEQLGKMIELADAKKRYKSPG